MTKRCEDCAHASCWLINLFLSKYAGTDVLWCELWDAPKIPPKPCHHYKRKWWKFWAKK